MWGKIYQVAMFHPFWMEVGTDELKNILKWEPTVIYKSQDNTETDKQ